MRGLAGELTNAGTIHAEKLSGSMRSHLVGVLLHRLSGLRTRDGQTLHVTAAELAVLPSGALRELASCYQPGHCAQRATEDLAGFAPGDRVPRLGHGRPLAGGGPVLSALQVAPAYPNA